MDLYYGLQKKTLTQKIWAIFCGPLICFLLGYAGYWVLKSHEERQAQLLKSDPAFTMGEVVRMKSYKGKGADIEYQVNGRTYVLGASLSNELYSALSDGDQIEVVYYRKDPDVADLAERFRYKKL